jgi:hypothetical protein
MSLTGPSRTIVVEPLELPEERPAVAPGPDREPARPAREPAPDRAPAEEPVPA